MKRTTGSALVIVALVALAGCSGEDLAEGMIERAAESEGNGDVDIDLSDGSFSVESEDGSFQMTTDEDGNVIVRGEDAEGNEVFSADSEDGVTQIETEDGDATFSQSGSLPDDFPDIPLPDELAVMMSQQSETADGTSNVVIGTAPGDWESYLDELTSFLESSGYTQNSLTTTPEGAFFQFVDAGETMAIAGSVGADPDSGGMSLNLVIGPN